MVGDLIQNHIEFHALQLAETHQFLKPFPKYLKAVHSYGFFYLLKLKYRLFLDKPHSIFWSH
jgi:hypothetical protein